MANQDRVNFVWAESALTTIPPIPVSEVAYRDTTQTPKQMAEGQKYDTIYNSARHNQLLFLLTSVAKTLCENGIMPFLAGQEYSQYARCIFTDGKLYAASRAILANEQPYPTPGDDSGVWRAEETSESLVPNSRRVIAGTGLTGGGPLSSDVTLAAKLDGKTMQATAGGMITAKDVAIKGNLEDLASARGQIGPARELGNNVDFNTVTEAGLYLINAAGSVNAPLRNQAFFLQVVRSVKGAITKNLFQIAYSYSSVADLVFIRQYRMASSSWSVWTQLITSSQVGDGITVNNGIISVPEYEGATASTAGTSGLVPPATAGQQESFLTGGGEYKPALSTSGGTITGELNIAAPAGSAEGGEITLINGTDGKYPAKIDTTCNVIRFFGGPHKPLGVDLETGKFVGDLAGNADTANRVTGLVYTFTTNGSLALPPGGTWFVLNWWDGDGGSAKGNWSGGQIAAGGSNIDVRNGAFALRVA